MLAVLAFFGALIIARASAVARALSATCTMPPRLCITSKKFWLQVAIMAPPESTRQSATAEHSNFTKQAPNSEGDFDRSNCLSKIEEYVRKVERFDLGDGKPDATLK